MAAEPRPGGRAGRLRPAPPARRTTSSRPTASTSSARIRGVDPIDIIRDAARADATAAGTRRPEERQLPPLHARARLADPARHRATPWGSRSTDAPAPATPSATRPSSSTTATARPARATCTRRWCSPRATRRPQVFFLQNNQWAISVPVATPVAHAAVPARRGLRHARACRSTATTCSPATPSPRRASTRRAPAAGPRCIEALTYRMGAHTTSDDPTKYRDVRRGGVLGARATRSPACELPARAAARPTAFFADVDDRGRGRRRRHPRPHDSSSAAPSADAMFDARLHRAAPARRRAAALARRLRGILRGGRIVTETIRAATARASGGRDELDASSTMPLSRALNAGLRAALAGRRPGAAHGRGHRPARRRLPRHRGPAGRVRRPARARHPARRVRHRRHRDRPGDARASGRCARSSSTASSSPAFDQITTQLAKHDQPARGRAAACPVVIRIPYGGHIGAVEHHQESPEAYFAHTAGPARGEPVDAERRVLDDPGGDRLATTR